MPLTIINSFASWVLKQRIHQIELFLKYPNEVQEELLLNLIQSSRTLLLGKEYDYASIHSYATFAELYLLRRITATNRAYPHRRAKCFWTLP
jgi:hypothetical protein